MLQFPPSQAWKTLRQSQLSHYFMLYKLFRNALNYHTCHRNGPVLSRWWVFVKRILIPHNISAPTGLLFEELSVKNRCQPPTQLALKLPTYTEYASPGSHFSLSFSRWHSSRLQWHITLQLFAGWYNDVLLIRGFRLKLRRVYQHWKWTDTLNSLNLVLICIHIDFFCWVPSEGLSLLIV